MVNKKLLFSFLLIVLVAISAGAVSAADSADILADTVPVEGDDNVAITDAIESANDGDTIDLGKDKVYNFNSSVEISKNITLTGENVTIQGIGSDMPDGLIEIYAAGAGSTISGLSFTNLDDASKYLYNE